MRSLSTPARGIGKCLLVISGLPLALLPATGFTQGYGADATPQASAAGTAMYSDLGAISGIGNTVLMTRVPVKSSTGAFSYQDITIQFDVAANGTLTLSQGFPKFVQSPPPITNNFRAGNYKDGFGNKYVVAGPGVLAGGRTKWTLSWVPPAGKTGSLNITWATGPVQGHPFEGKLTYYKITGTTYSWGLVGTAAAGSGGYPNPPFDGYYVVDRPFGAWQTGDQLEIHNFYSGGNQEVSHLFLTRCSAAC